MIREIRGLGLMQVVEFEMDRKDFALSDVFDKLLGRGFLVGYKPTGNLLRFLPPLTISHEDIQSMIDALANLLPRNV